MRDNGMVLHVEKDTADVEVHCLEACRDCSAKALCTGHTRNRGRLTVKNPLHASPGDLVTIEIPEGRYNQALILIFGGLLVALLAGLGAGHLISRILRIASPLVFLLGAGVGLFSGGLALFFYFKKKFGAGLYPRIVDIVDKGGCYGQA